MKHIAKGLLIIRSVYLFLVAAVSLLVAIFIASCFSLFTNDKTQPFQTWARIWARFVLWVADCKVSISGEENIPRNQGVFFVANHQSFADAYLILACTPINFVSVIKNTYFWLPIYGYGWRKCGYIPIFQDSPLTFIAAAQKMVALLKRGQSVLTFPEGTRSPDGKVHAFRQASLMPALQSGAPIVPIAIYGSNKVIPYGALIVYRKPVKFKFGKPVYIKSIDEYDQKLNELHSAIISMLEEA
jgi:1-acyl-sn-glycerol-3-phosphate acyltransferase